MVVITIIRSLFKKHVHEIKTAHLERVINFLNEIESFEVLSQDKIVQIAGKCELVLLHSNSEIIREGEESKFLYFIMYGHVRLSQKVFFKTQSRRNQSVSTDFQVADSIEDPTTEEISSGRVFSESLVVGELGKGGVICEEAFFNQSKVPYNASTTLPTELIKISLYDFGRLVNEKLESVIGPIMKQMPKMASLRRTFFERKRWDQYKKYMATDVLNQKKNLFM